MQVARNTVVTLSFKLFNADGELIEEAESGLEYLHGGFGGIFPKVEVALDEQQVGYECSVLLEPADAFGDYDEALVRIEPIEKFPANLQVGMQFEATGADDASEEDLVVYTVTDIADGKVVVDGNHPLAGERLRFDCRVIDVRTATREEVEHGHVHGPQGHHHH